MQNQDEMQVTHNVKDPIKILFGQMETGKELTIVGNSPLSDRKLADMGVAKGLTTQ